jgi:hypothetical protein
MDPGPCRPGETTNDSNAWLIQTFCPAAGVTRVHIDLGDREDTATFGLAIPVELVGGPGADRLTTGDAADVVDGGEGNDRVITGGGDDDVTGGNGVDEIDAGPGADTIRVRDGLRDIVRCGDGADRVDADDFDDLGADCEGVARTVTPPPPEAGAIATDTTPPRLDVGALTRQRLGRRGVIRVAATSSERGSIGVSGFIDIGGLSRPLSGARARIGVAGGGAEVALRLTARQVREVRRALRRKRRVVVRLSVTATDAAGNTTTRRAPRIRLSA